jgi:excisionase family DNA binding protein
MAKNQESVERQTYSLWPEAGKLAGLSRGATYAAADRGDIPTIRIGNRRLVPKSQLNKLLGIEG